GIILYRGHQPALAAITGLFLPIATALASHAAGARVAPTLAIAVDTLHLVAAALWIGGLFQLCLLLPSALRLSREKRSEMLRAVVPRTSAVFVPTVAVLVATGIFSAWEQVGTFEALFSTAHGQSLLLKL